MKQKFCSLFSVYLFLCVPLVAFGDTSNINGLVFTNQEYSLKTGEISGELKVQTQNALGSAESVSETNDVTFISSSATGEFLNSSGNPVTKTMSKNTSSRTFFYRDSTEGVYQITINIKGRDTGKAFEASQHITISNSSSGNSGSGSTSTTTSNTATTTQNTATTTPSSSNETQILSAHSNTQTITYVVDIPELKADAGRRRLTTTESPIEFEAESSGVENWLGNVQYVWSFGDGATESGKIVSHTYHFAGDYVVILNVTGNNKRAVSRTEVKVIDPNVTILTIQRGQNGYVELLNNSPYEVNIQDWKITSGSDEMILPKDTIIKANSSVKFSFGFLTEGGEVSLVYPRSTMGGVADVSPISYVEPSREDIERAKAKVAKEFALQNKLDNPVESESLDSSNSTEETVNPDPGHPSIIEKLDTAKQNDSSSFLASPYKLFSIFKNFFTK